MASMPAPRDGWFHSCTHVWKRMSSKLMDPLAVPMTSYDAEPLVSNASDDATPSFGLSGMRNASRGDR